MKIKHLVTLGAAAGMSFSAAAQQQQSPFQTPAAVPPPAVPQPAVVTQPQNVGGPVVLNLTGVTVTDAAGQPVGPIQHILLSPAGCVDMAALSLGGQKLVAVPWQLIGGSGATRGEADIATRAAFSLKGVDRTVLMSAPVITTAQLSQPQVLEQSRTFFAQHQQTQQQPGAAVGGSSAQSGVNVGVGANANVTNGVGITNAGIGTTRGFTNATANTNQTGILSPTGPTNTVPGRPAYETNRPGQPTIIPPGRPGYRPPTNTPSAGTPPGTGTIPNDPNRP